MSTPQHPHPSRPPCHHGFTLVELMITLAVLVVVMAVAVPSLQEFSANNQLVATKSQFAAAVSLARTEAGKRGRVVALQALGNGPAGNEFAGGWEVAADDDNNGSVASTETRVRRTATMLERIKLGGPVLLGFRASGALVGGAAQVYTLCRASGGTKGYTVTVMPSGATDVALINNCS